MYVATYVWLTIFKNIHSILIFLCTNYSEWGYYRNDSSECTLNTEYGPKSDCLTGYGYLSVHKYKNKYTLGLSNYREFVIVWDYS